MITNQILAIKKQAILGSTLSYQSPAKISDFKRPKENPDDHEHKAEFKKIGKILDKYRGEINEVAILIEGLISLMTIKPFPAFEINHVNVRLVPENKKEEEEIKKGGLLHTMGDIGKGRGTALSTVGKPDEMFSLISVAQNRLSSLSIYSLAVRAEERYEMEIAYSNFFRIIEGYLGDGTPKIEKAIKKNSTILFKHMKVNKEFLDSLRTMLSNLSLPTKAKSLKDHNGIISDLVLLRHKLMHYNLKNQDRYFYSSLRVELRPVVNQLYRAAFLLIRFDLQPEGKGQ